MSNVYLVPSSTTTIVANSTASTNTSTNTIWIGSPTSTTLVNPIRTNSTTMPVQLVEVVPDHISLQPGKARTITFPDGTVIDFQKDGSFKIEDKDAKVIYKAARVRDFNPFLNASDKLEDFIKFCGSAGVRQDDMLGIPIKQFVQWLVIEAARADGEPTTEVLMLPKPDVFLQEEIMEYWKVLYLANTTDANDLRALCANRLRGPYVINRDSNQIAVLLDKDIGTVLSAFDVVDRKLETSVYQGNNTLMLASVAWHDYLKAGRQ